MYNNIYRKLPPISPPEYKGGFPLTENFPRTGTENFLWLISTFFSGALFQIRK